MKNLEKERSRYMPVAQSEKKRLKLLGLIVRMEEQRLTKIIQRHTHQQADAHEEDKKHG